MSERLSRRAALKHLAAAGVGCGLQSRRHPRPVHADSHRRDASGDSVASISPVTVRITVAAIVGTGGVPDDGALVAAAEGKPLARRRTADAFAPVRAGNLIGALHRRPAGDSRRHRARDSPSSAWHSAPTSRACRSSCPRDRCSASARAGRSSIARARSIACATARAAISCRTHGGRVPIQWLVGTDGWGMFIHQPLGAFDFTGAEGTLTPAARRRCRSTSSSSASRDPKRSSCASTRGITGLPELPPLWTFGYMQSHRTLAGPGRDHVGRADVPREEAAVRRADLSRHGIHAVGMEHAQRRVRLEDGELPRSEEGDRRAARACTTRSCCTS